MEHLKDYFGANDKLAAYLGIEMTEIGPGRAVARMELRECHMNAVRTAHGGAIFTLADYAFAGACNSHGTVAVAINVGINFIRPARSGVLTAVATEDSVNLKLGNYTVRVTDEQNELVAVFQGLAYRKKDRILGTP